MNGLIVSKGHNLNKELEPHKILDCMKGEINLKTIIPHLIIS